MSGPIRSEEVGPKKAADLPPEVFDAFNTLIARNWRGGSARAFVSQM